MVDSASKIHFVGVGGVGVGTLAMALARRGLQVTGSDQALYEPMLSQLKASRLQLIEGFSAETAEKFQPDLVVIGNVIRRDNVEAQAWIRKGIPFLSFPESVRQFVIRDTKSIVCAGTHGKTTTTSWLAYLLKGLGANPSYLIGGVPRDLDYGCEATDGAFFVGEGDEYDSAFFDKGPKFLHYNPSIAIIANVEFDHADIYRDLDHVKASFEKLVAILPGDGLCLARQEDVNVNEVVRGALCPVQTFGVAPGALWRVGKVDQDTKGYVFEVLYKGRSAGSFRTKLFGQHNLVNLLSGIACAVNLGYSMEKIQPLVEGFRGARRRQEILLEEPITIVDDFAHHPTEVAATLQGVRTRYPQAKIWACFEPRSATARRNTHQEAYVASFDLADTVFLCAPYKASDLDADRRLSVQNLVDGLTQRGKSSECFEKPADIVSALKVQVKPGDVILVMSNGEFGKIQSTLLQHFKTA